MSDLFAVLAPLLSSHLIPELEGAGNVVGASFLGVVSENKWFNVFACLSRSVKGSSPKILSTVASTEV